MKIKCFSCGVEKDTSDLVYYSGDCGLIDDEPINPLLYLSVEGPRQTNSEHHEYRLAVVCHKCFDLLDPDMWISKKMWDALNPKIQYLDLPYEDDKIDSVEEIALTIEDKLSMI